MDLLVSTAGKYSNGGRVGRRTWFGSGTSAAWGCWQYTGSRR